MKTFDTQTRIVDLTVGELISIINQQMHKEEAEAESKRHKVFGIAGIASIFNCSTATANRIKKSGRIDKAIVQHGRLIIVDADLALQLYNNR